MTRAAASAEQNTDAAAVMKIGQLYRPIYVEETDCAHAHGAARPIGRSSSASRIFGRNHFAVSVDKVAVLGLAGSFEREAIRPHVLGNFTDLLLASTRHPAMLLYLDNQTSVGPNSPARAPRRAARERASLRHQ